jgi:hypothetical protein
MSIIKANRAVIIIFILITGCTTHIYKGGELRGDEGLVMLSTHCSHPITAFTAFSSASSINFMSAEFPDVAFLCDRSKNAILVELPVGTYFVGTIDYYAGQNVYAQHSTAKFLIDEKDALKFRVKPNGVTYIGMLVGSSRWIKGDGPDSSKKYTMGIYSRDREDRDIKSIEADYPGILKKYPYQKAIAKM